MADCERAGKWFRGCNWETIYDVKEPSKALQDSIETTWQLPQWLAKLGIEDTRYVGALCKTCGKYIARDGSSDE
jgi:hypothetical protein